MMTIKFQASSPNKLVNFLRYGGIAITIAIICTILTFKTWVAVPKLASTVIWMHWVALFFMITGTLLIALITYKAIWRRSISNGSELGRDFVFSLILVLFSYGVNWHLSSEYFRYLDTAWIISLLVLAASQAAIWNSTIKSEATLGFTTKSHRSWLVPILASSLVAFVVSTIVMFRTVRFEDAYITFRYGWNLAQGNGITWNAGDSIPSEGYTTFTYVLLSGLFYALNIDPLNGTRAVNLLCLGFLGYFIWRLAREIFPERPGIYALIPVAILFAIPATEFHIATGMETLFYTATLAGVSSLAIHWLGQERKDVRLIYGLGSMILISALTRPEGVLYGLITLVLLISISRQEFLTRQNIIALIVSLILPGIIYFLWRVSYFKLLLPLSFFHKSFVGGLYNHATRSVLFTDYIGMIVLPYLGIISYRIFTHTLPRSASMLLVPALVLTCYYSRVLAVAGLQYRFFFPYLAPLLVIASNDLGKIIDRIEERVNLHFIFPLFSVGLFMFFCLGPFFYEARNIITFLLAGTVYNSENDPYPRIGRALLNLDRDEVIGTGEVGKIGMMLRDYTIIDIVGLNDRYLARHPFSGDYIDQRKINILIIYPYPGASLGVYADVYKKVGEGFKDIEARFLCVGNIQGLDVFVRKNPPGMVENYIQKLKKSKYFDAGICLSNTTARWAPRELTLWVDGWNYSDLEKGEAPNEFLVTGNDPILRSSTLDIKADEFNNVIVNLVIPPPVECSVFTLYFTRTDAPEESEDRSVYIPFTPDPKPQPIIVNIRKHPEWHGIIEHIRLDPVCGMNKDMSSIRFRVENLILH